MPIVGIDLGTTNSLVACFRDGRSRILPNAQGELLTPSVVSVLESGELVVGQAAKERLYTHPAVTAAAFKRFMGTKKAYRLGPHTFTPVELSSLVLKSLKADAAAALGEPVVEAVVSVPAYFNEQQRRATQQAGELAGLTVQRLVSEPTAAALAYGLHETDTETDRRFLVFDLGGGTFDVSIVELFYNILEVKAVAGDGFLGGEDFDQAIATWFATTQGLAPTGKDAAIIKEKAEAAKRQLTDADPVEMKVTLGDTPLTATLTRDQLAVIAEPLLDRIRQPVLRAMHDARLRPSDLAQVILVGGSSRMPLIREYAATLFDRTPLDAINPDEAVALGAGVAAALKERHVDLAERLVTDVCPYTLGTNICSENRLGGLTPNVYLPIIERNTVIPCSKVQRLTTIVDDQREILITVYQGESRQADQNLKLGELMIDIPPKPAGQARVDVRYTYDINGLLEVEVTSVDTKETKREVIVNSENQLSPAEIEDCLKRLSALKIHPRDQASNQFLLSRAERLYEEALGDARIRIGEETRTFEAILDKQDSGLIDRAAAEFAVFLDEMERRL